MVFNSIKFLRDSKKAKGGAVSRPKWKYGNSTNNCPKNPELASNYLFGYLHLDHAYIMKLFKQKNQENTLIYITKSLA